MVLNQSACIFALGYFLKVFIIWIVFVADIMCSLIG